MTHTIPPYAQSLLNLQALLEIELAELDLIISRAERYPNGLTVEAAKTPEWRAARAKRAMVFNSYRKVNIQLSRIRKLTGYVAENGRRVAIYQYHHARLTEEA